MFTRKGVHLLTETFVCLNIHSERDSSQGVSSKATLQSHILLNISALDPGRAPFSLYP